MNKIISDISDYIFISDEPEKVDASFCREGHILSNLNMRPNCTIKVMSSGLFPLVELVLSEINGQVFVRKQKYILAITNPTARSLSMCLQKTVYL